MYAYNPRKKTREQLEKSLVGDDRWDTLNNILREMALEKGEGPKQHWMLIGPRGIGKSHLMTLLYYKIHENKKLNKLWVPLLFPEELRMTGSLSKFLERAFNEILLELGGDKCPISGELSQKIEKIRISQNSERSDNFFSLISWFHQKTGKHIVFIAENLQQLLGKKIPQIEQKKLRAFLQTSDALLMIGSATTIFDALHDHSHPFYHFFHIKRLRELSFSDMKTLLINLLSESNRSDLADELREKDARLKALYSFTGGNPRLAVFLCDILKTEVPDEMLELMDNILDQLTPYFEAILKDIPDYLEEIINTLSTFEPAQSPKEIAMRLELPPATVRNYIKQLKEIGYVRVVFSKGKSNYYCLNEYLYRTWYQMRDSSHREEARWLMELLLMLYSPDKIIKESNKVKASVQKEEATFSYEKLIVQAADFIARYPDTCMIIESFVNFAKDNKKGEIIYEKEKEFLKEAFKYLKDNQYDQAIKLCKDTIKNNPKLEDGYMVWGICLNYQGRYEEAIKKYKQAIKTNPKSEAAYWQLGICLLKQELYEEAIKKYKQAIKINPKSEVAYWQWGACLLKQELYEEAIKKYKQAIKINPKSEVAYWQWGACLLKQELYEEAIKKYKQAIKINPKSKAAYRQWGACLCEQELYEEAIEKFKKAINIDSKLYASYGAIGECYKFMGRYIKAEEQYKKAIEINDKYDDAHRALGNCLQMQGRYEEAIEKFKQAIKINPKSKASYLMWGICLYEQEFYEEAIEKFKKEIDTYPKFAPAFKHWAECLQKLGRYEEAVGIFKKHLYDSDDSDVIHSYGNCLMGAKYYKEALSQFDRLIDLDPDNYKVYLSYGLLLEMMKDNENSLLNYLKHISIGFNAHPESFDFQKIFSECLLPILQTLTPGKYIKQFYAAHKDNVLSEPQLAILLVLLAKYDTVIEHLPEIAETYQEKEIDCKKDFSLLIFTIKMCIWLKLCEDNLSDGLRLVDLYIEYIKSLKSAKKKENEVSNFSMGLFRVQINLGIDPQNTKKILNCLKSADDVPFSDVLFKIWTCISEPNSVDAQRYLSDKAIADVVMELRADDSTSKT